MTRGDATGFIQKRWFRIAVLAAGALAALWVGYLLRAVLNPLLVAALLAYILNPFVTWMERRGVPRFRAILVLYAAGVLCAILALLYATPRLYRQSTESAERLRAYIERQPQAVETFIGTLRERAAQIPYYGDAMALLSLFFDEPKRREDFQERLAKVLSWLGDRATGTVRSAFTLLSYLLLVPLYTFYFLERIPALFREIPPLIPPPIRRQTLEILSRIDLAMAGFVFGRSLVCLAKGAVVALGLWIVDVPYAVLLGFLTAVLSLLPAASFIGAGGIALLLAFVDEGRTVAIAGVVVTFVLSEVLEGIANPVILGRSASLHPVMIVFAMFAFGKLLGLFGVLLAVPLASATKILWSDLARPYIAAAWGEGDKKP